MPFIAHPAIRTRGTIGGSLAHADPAAELPAVMLALDAHVRRASRQGARHGAGDRLLHGPVLDRARAWRAADRHLDSRRPPIRGSRRVRVPGDLAPPRRLRAGRRRRRRSRSTSAADVRRAGRAAQRRRPAGARARGRHGARRRGAVGRGDSRRGRDAPPSTTSIHQRHPRVEPLSAPAGGGADPTRSRARVHARRIESGVPS